MGGWGGGEWPKLNPSEVQAQNGASDLRMLKEISLLKQVFGEPDGLVQLLIQIAESKREPTAEEKIKLREFALKVQDWTWGVVHYHRLR